MKTAPGSLRQATSRPHNLTAERAQMNHASGLLLCTRCVLPGTFPNITFDSEGVCNYCRMQEELDTTDFIASQKLEFDSTVASLRGRYAYDAICCYSGGKDSTYMLKVMVEDYGLSVLSYTLDNGYITPQARENIRRMTGLLAVDHLFYSPSQAFMRRLYREAMVGDLNKGRGNYRTRISDVCLSCITLVNTQAARIAIERQIPMVFAGFTPGQIPRAVIRNHYRHYQETSRVYGPHLEERLGTDARRYFSLPESQLEVYQMSPYLFMQVKEKEILAAIRALGWVAPENLDGCTTNCALNVAGNLCHQKRHGFHPYASEMSILIRKGLLGRSEALEKLSSGVDDAKIEGILNGLGMSMSDLVF